MKDKVITCALWINEHVVMSPWTFMLVIVLLAIVYAQLPIEGFQKWNTGIGLFMNTNGSNFELLTGVGAGLAVFSKISKHHKKIEETQAKHHKEVMKVLKEHIHVDTNKDKA